MSDTPLMGAVFHGRRKIATSLLRAGADPHKTNWRGQDAFYSLSEARERLGEEKYQELLKLLGTNWTKRRI